MSAHLQKHHFGKFDWIDVCQPQPDDLAVLAKEFELDYFQVKDSLEAGHLPKFERQPKYNFLILRAYTAEPDDRVTNVSELSNKIAFFLQRAESHHGAPHPVCLS
jgi:magnesium transporter